MTQEELNELILGNFDDKILTEKEPPKPENIPKESLLDDSDIDLEVDKNNFDVEHYRVSSDAKWPPPPPIDDHKVVHQLDDVTKGLEAKASQVFDQLDSISQNSDDIQKDVKALKEMISSQKDLFETLSHSFPNIKKFQDSLKSCDEMLKKTIAIANKTNDTSDCTLQAMDIMQYQDIHRQKIERVVNIMRALAKYLNSIFASDIDDDKRVSSATYLEGDEKDDVVSGDEIENLISTLGKK